MVDKESEPSSRTLYFFSPCRAMSVQRDFTAAEWAGSGDPPLIRSAPRPSTRVVAGGADVPSDAPFGRAPSKFAQCVVHNTHTEISSRSSRDGRWTELWVN